MRVRKHLSGTPGKPRLAVFRSGKHIYAQVIDDTIGKTLVFASDLKLKKLGVKKDQGFEVGKILAAEAVKKGITTVVFDRGGFLYHGRVERLAAGAREGGLKF
ncbi:MAG: 50S ribosomal protein L18 [Candidatus Daviesbacteria bacterium GW2011_GWA2_42_7]|nr:MAG: 50S ribosomal protein L18 [Candidatus Daviesbacteria bacterium GW2011_GWA2_42_7]